MKMELKLVMEMDDHKTQNTKVKFLISARERLLVIDFKSSVGAIRARFGTTSQHPVIV